MKPPAITRRTLCKTILSMSLLPAVDPLQILSGVEKKPPEELEPKAEPLGDEKPMVISICGGNHSRHSGISRTLTSQRKLT